MDRNFVVETEFLDERDIPLFFGKEEVEKIPENSTMLDILVACGIFRSKGEARKNGWGDVKKQKIPLGFSEFEVGRLKHKITVLNPWTKWK